MELEELKNKWNTLDERLKGQNQTNESALQQLIRKQNKSIWDKLISFEFRHILFLFILCIFIFSNREVFEMQNHGTDMLVITYILQIVAFLNRGSKIIFLRRHDISRESIVKTLKTITIYKRWVQIEYMAATIVTSNVVMLMLYWFTAENTTLRYLFICILLICIGFIAWSVFYVYGKNIREIQQNLKDLEESENK